MAARKSIPQEKDQKKVSGTSKMIITLICGVWESGGEVSETESGYNVDKNMNTKGFSD